MLTSPHFPTPPQKKHVMQPRVTARKEPQHMSFVSVNSERNTTKNCAKLFLLACAMVNSSKERKRGNSLRENVKN